METPDEHANAAGVALPTAEQAKLLRNYGRIIGWCSVLGLLLLSLAFYNVIRGTNRLGGLPMWYEVSLALGFLVPAAFTWTRRHRLERQVSAGSSVVPRHMSRVLTILVAFGIAAVVLAIPSIALVLSPDIRQEATRTTRAEVIAVVEAALRAAYASESAERIEVACQEAQTSGRESVARRFTSPFQDVTDVEYGETVFDVFLTDYCSAG